MLTCHDWVLERVISDSSLPFAGFVVYTSCSDYLLTLCLRSWTVRPTSTAKRSWAHAWLLGEAQWIDTEWKVELIQTEDNLERCKRQWTYHWLTGLGWLQKFMGVSSSRPSSLWVRKEGRADLAISHALFPAAKLQHSIRSGQEIREGS